MDKLEYIPRDLVSVYVGIKKYIVEVIGTENENEVLSYQIKFPNGEIQYADKDNIVPIPLTPEILEKNGWKSINGKYALKIKNANYVVLEFTEDGIYTYINENTMLFTIKYIHELQHLLFGLGINSEIEV